MLCEAKIPDPQLRMNLNVPYFRQERRNTCGVAALRMVLAYLGEAVSEKELISNIKLHSFGTFTTDLGLVTLKKGYSVSCYTFHLPLLGKLNLELGTKVNKSILKKIKITPKTRMCFNSWKSFIEAGGELIWDIPRLHQLKSNIKQKNPSMISFNTASLGRYWNKWDNGHFFVVTGFNKDKIKVLDPSRKRVRTGDEIEGDRLFVAWSVNAFQSSAYLTQIMKK